MDWLSDPTLLSALGLDADGREYRAAALGGPTPHSPSAASIVWEPLLAKFVVGNVTIAVAAGWGFPFESTEVIHQTGVWARAAQVSEWSGIIHTELPSLNMPHQTHTQSPSQWGHQSINQSVNQSISQ